jgi:hypothetical protein
MIVFVEWIFRILCFFFLEPVLLLHKSICGAFGSFRLNISVMTMHVQKEGITEEWVPSLQEANLPQGS